MLASERARYIINALKTDGIISLKDIAKTLNTSEATVRRDFEKLEKEGCLVRVTGGAKTTESDGISNLAVPTTMSNEDVHSEEKLIVAKRACDFIDEGDCIFIDAGTSTAAMAQFIWNMHIKIITNSTLFVNSIHSSAAEIVLVGGTYVPHYKLSVGILAQEILRNFHFDKAFISCTGADVSSEAAFVFDMDSKEIKRTAMKNSDKNFLLIDAGKLDRRSLCRFASLPDFDKIICNRASSNIVLPDNFLIV